jgi:Uma2 family endonuclease
VSSVRSAIPDALDRHIVSNGRRVHRFTYDEFLRMDASGVFGDKRVELIEGRVVEMPPQGPRHYVATGKTYEALRRVTPPGHHIPPTPQLRLSESAPLPDCCIVPGRIEDYQAAVPTTAILVVEVSDSTLADDRLDKGSLYASAGIRDYWIVNLVDNVLQVYRDPRPDATQPSGSGYATVTVHPRGDSVSPLLIPTASVAISDFFP